MISAHPATRVEGLYESERGQPCPRVGRWTFNVHGAGARSRIGDAFLEPLGEDTGPTGGRSGRRTCSADNDRFCGTDNLKLLGHGRMTANVLPLPGGEGWGEGKGALNTAALSRRVAEVQQAGLSLRNSSEHSDWFPSPFPSPLPSLRGEGTRIPSLNKSTHIAGLSLRRQSGSKLAALQTLARSYTSSRVHDSNARSRNRRACQ